ncbi:VOC family protein [Nodularia sphaerocarpa]|uniref:VOC family protein n=1 Tax=Nodularia sphaerocarpa TaxID=137816 RepID=UPI001EFC09AB|nr:VOC family protein [Nodularia sphaerocarpa]MDB9373191.1 VOC family protein [Nodularia sphaerocarpa CS-585]MDB9378289.1 VOC family protein [Nodularia sphaerocarpa CS-585A2]ULP70649.1 Glutathione transferase FosA [Nodularia sphaerocarpa UHCC 0038]
MTITLDHTIVPAYDKEKSARFFADIFGLKLDTPVGHFAAVRVNDKLTLDFADREEFDSHHYAFHVSDEEFDTIFARIQEMGLEYSSDPMHHKKGEINHRMGGRGFYFYDLDGHNLELLTRA